MNSLHEARRGPFSPSSHLRVLVISTFWLFEKTSPSLIWPSFRCFFAQLKLPGTDISESQMQLDASDAGILTKSSKSYNLKLGLFEHRAQSSAKSWSGQSPPMERFWVEWQCCGRPTLIHYQIASITTPNPWSCLNRTNVTERPGALIGFWMTKSFRSRSCGVDVAEGEGSTVWVVAR